MSPNRTSQFNDPLAPPSARILSSNLNPFVAALVRSAKDRSLPAMLGAEARELRGRWHRNFSRERDTEIIVEIGCYNGQMLSALAKAFPEKLFLGLDITYKRVVLSARKVASEGLNNALCIKADGRFLGELFAPGEISGLIAWYPDPWPKARHAKHRLFNPAFTGSLRAMLRKPGFLWVKTDSPSYLTQIKQHAAGLQEQGEPSAALVHCLLDTPFESLFRRQNIRCYSQFWNNY